MLCHKLQRNCNSFFFHLHKPILITQNVQLSNQETSVKNNLNIIKVYNYLKECNLETFVKVLKNRRGNKSKNVRMNLVDPCVAKTLSSMIYKDLLQRESIVIQCNPGLGLLTQELLSVGVPFIHLFENDPIFLSENSPLSILYSKHRTHLNLKNINFTKMLLPILRNKYFPNDKLKTHLADVGFHDTNKKTIRLIAGAVNRDFIALLIINFYEQTKLFKNADPIIYMIVQPLIWWRLAYTFTNMQFYSHFCVFLHLFFDIKYLGTLPRESFVPWTKEMLKNNLDKSENHMIVIKIMLKQDYASLIPKEDLLPFAFFLKYGMRSKSIRVINELEKLVPDCGSRLIKLNFNKQSTFKELTPQELLNLFKNFRSWPEYDICLICPEDRI